MTAGATFAAMPPVQKKKLGSYPTFLVVFSITLALVVIGLFGLLLVHAQKLSEVVRENLEVQVYLDRDLPETELLRLQQDLGQLPFVAERDGKPQIRFVSKEEGARQLLQSTGEDFRQFLADNPLRDAYVLKISPNSPILPTCANSTARSQPSAAYLRYSTRGTCLPASTTT